jgi:gliding motility associated protien GldN
MKPFYYISFFVLLFACMQESFAQDQPKRSVRQRPSEANAPTVSNLTERAKIKNEEESQKPRHIVWERIIYRMVDLTNGDNNSALYYPVQPQDNRQNLFTLIFKLLSDAKITAYNYLEGSETFEESQKFDFESNFLTKYQLLYTKEGDRFVVDERDIPSSEVTLYMIKEGYYFDQATGTFKSEVIAICPVLVREDFYYGSSTREALFWLKYNDIRPYLSREMIMTSNYNNALTHTIDDYFHKNMYSGEIIKTVNMMGKSLAQEVGSDPEAQKQAQDSIENQLKSFDQKLWIYKTQKDTTLVEEKGKGKKAAKETTSAKRGDKEQKSKSASSKTKSENPSPAKSVRRNR